MDCCVYRTLPNRRGQHILLCLLRTAVQYYSNFVNLVLGMDYFDSGPGVRNLTQPDAPPETLRVAYKQIATRRGGGIHTAGA